MRTFLNLAFKFLSRSIIIATMLFAVTPYAQADFLSECLVRHPGENVKCGRCAEFANSGQTQCEAREFGTGQTTPLNATVNFIKAENKETEITINTGGRYRISWQSTSAAVCSLSSNQPFSWIVPPAGYILEEDAGSWLGASGNDELIYTITCFTKGIPNGTVTEYTVTNPYTQTTPSNYLRQTDGASSPKTVTVKVADQSETSCDPGDTKCVSVCTNYPGSDVCKACKAGSDNANCLPQCTAPGNPVCNGTTSQVNEVAAPKPQECGFSNMKQCALDLFDNTVLPLFTAFLRLCSVIFELAVWIGIVKFSVLVGTGPDAWIVAIWSTIRDILNIGVIFVLLYSAINIIVGRGGEIKKLIAGVILFGVLTNFSLFLTRAAVDVSNVVALEFYNQMRTEDDIHNVSFNRGLGATVVEITGLVKFYDAGEGGGVSQEIKTRSKIQDSFMFRFGMIIVFIAVGFMFLQAAFIFIARTVSLVFLLIFSPLMFAGGIFSPIKGAIEKWHKEFLGQVILAPLFFILLYVALTILKNVTDTLDTELGKLYDSGEDYILPFSIIILTSGLVIFSFSLAVSKAKEYAGSIGGKAASYGNKMGGFILGKGVGGAASITARLGQQTLGRFGNSIEGTGLMARTGQFLFKDRSFDVRNVPGTAKVGQGINKILSTATGAPVTVSAGEGLKGRETRKKEAAEVEQKKADTQIETALKKIDDKTKQYDVFDNTTVDVTGATITRAANETDEAWEKKINIANKYEKGKTLASKNAYLASHPVATQGSSTLKRASQKAQFKAIKAQQKKLSSETKKEAEHLARKDKLKAYKDELANTFASNASTRLQPPLDGIRLVKNKSEIEAMNDEEVIALWDEIADSVSTEIKLYKADKKSIIDNPNQHSMDDQREVFRAISSFEKLQKKAGNASKDIESLKKAIEAHEQKK